MTGFNIEAAIRSLYTNGISVRREAWPEDTYVCLPDFRYYDPLMQDGSAFQPDKMDFLMEDWITITGVPLVVNENHRNGFYAAMRYIYATGKSVAIDLWDVNTWVFMPTGVDGVLYIRSIEDGMQSVEKYIPSRDDYLSDRWHPRVFK